MELQCSKSTEAWAQCKRPWQLAGDRLRATFDKVNVLYDLLKVGSLSINYLCWDSLIDSFETRVPTERHWFLIQIFNLQLWRLTVRRSLSTSSLGQSIAQITETRRHRYGSFST